MLRRTLTLTASLLVLTGCDTGTGGGDGPPGDFTQTCADIGDSADGVMTANVQAGTFTATCFDVSTLSGNLQIRGTNVRFGLDGSIARGAETVLVIGGAQLGESEIGSPSGSSQARYTTPDGSTQNAAVGQILLAESSATRVRGTFTFTTTAGIEVTSGAFSIAP